LAEVKTRIYSTWLVLGLGLLYAVANGKPMPAKESQGITVRVINPAGVPAKTLRKAERVAATILDAAGIAITWLECPCPPALGRHDFWLHLLKDRPPQMHGDATGFAVLMPERDGAVSYAGVVWPAVEEVADGLASEVSDVLGATVAHEIGHILLGSKAHTRSGVMCSRFQRTHIGMAARGELRFAPEQARRMQATGGEQVLAKQSNR
jgi:hypothetical protein